MGKISDYAQFVKLRLTVLVVFSAVIGYFIGIRELRFNAEWMQLTALIVGGFLVTGSSNGFNQVIERDLDKLMPRTMKRPLPQGRMSVREGIILASVMGISGIILLTLYTNYLGGILGALALLLYTCVYTPSKRFTPFATFIGAFPGAIPPMLGWVAAVHGFGFIGSSALLLFATQFMWQFPHFWAIAWVSHEDYLKAGFHLLPSKGGRDKSSAFQIVVYTLCLIPISLFPVLFHMSGTISVIIAIICGTLFFLQALRLYRTCEVRDAQRLMFGSFIYLPVIQLAYLFG
ncbi:MAG: protoheme IX farnesyltransferase [Bacteroidetes bacterium]|nr:protoheme IX farnesyltransferase [Bacteroidota bacterium]